MGCNPRYEILFEPVRIGPVTAPNRFYQTPHATGMGYLKPESSAALRGIKAEGGWGVVSTEYCSIHPSSEDSPFGFLSLWDEDDVRALAKTADAIHAHGSLAAVELWHGGAHANNRLTREPMLAPSAQPAKFVQPARRAPWTGRTSASSAAGSARRRSVPSGPASTSSIAMPATTICRSSSCRRAPTGAATNMAARWKTACGCCAK